jgi:transmembrane sensor
MTSGNENLKRIAAYLAGELSSAERLHFEQWLKESTANEGLFHEASRIWKNSGKKLYLHGVDTDLQWNELNSRLESSEKHGKIVSFFNQNTSILKIAASVIILSGLSYFFLWVFHKEIVISSGNNVATVYLPDSSRVWLNTNSKLTYPKDFGKQQRFAQLEGEGYFEIIPDKRSTFTVATRNTITQIIGTSFNIKEDSEEVTVTVTEGTVKFSQADLPDEKSVTVHAQEKAVWKTKDKIQKSKSTNSDFAAWRKLNNPEFEKEKQNPQNYLRTAYTWRKNQINQSVIEGTIKNTATLADYRNIVLKVTYTKPNGKITTVSVKVSGKVHAGATIPYQKRLLDILTNTRSLKVEIKSAEISYE